MNGSAPLNLMSGTASSLAPCPREQFARRRAFPNGLVLDQAVFLSPGRPKTKMPPWGAASRRRSVGVFFISLIPCFSPSRSAEPPIAGTTLHAPVCLARKNCLPKACKVKNPTSSCKKTFGVFPFDSQNMGIISKKKATN
jgi:hypothetical protein